MSVTFLGIQNDTVWPLLDLFSIECSTVSDKIPSNVSKILLTQPLFQDLAWFNTFLDRYNGVTFYDQANSNIEVHLDACLTGLGGHFGYMIYTLLIPINFQQYDITQLEMLNIVVAAKI